MGGAQRGLDTKIWAWTRFFNNAKISRGRKTHFVSIQQNLPIGHNSDYFAEVLLHRVVSAHSSPTNQSFSYATFPAVHKEGLVTPLLKKPGLDTSDLKNFRPITNRSTISKITERLALSRLKSQLTSSPNFCPHQSAYWSSHSTETALIKIVDDILTSIDSVVGLMGLDISAAFDTVDHQRLLDRLKLWVWHRLDSTSVDRIIPKI